MKNTNKNNMVFCVKMKNNWQIPVSTNYFGRFFPVAFCGDGIWKMAPACVRVRVRVRV